MNSTTLFKKKVFLSGTLQHRCILDFACGTHRSCGSSENNSGYTLLEKNWQFLYQAGQHRVKSKGTETPVHDPLLAEQKLRTSTTDKIQKYTFHPSKVLSNISRFSQFPPLHGPFTDPILDAIFPPLPRIFKKYSE